MNQKFEQNPAGVAILGCLQKLFGEFGTVAATGLSVKGIVEEFRPGVVKSTDLAGLPRPSLDWAFAVEAGVVSGESQLCAIVFTHFSRMEAFYNLNPHLHGTLVTCWHGAATIWLRATGRLPVNFHADGTRWCSRGIIFVGCPDQPIEKFLSLLGEIKVVDFSHLVWSEVQQAEIDQCFLEAEVGPPFTVGARGRRKLSIAFWAKWIMSQFTFTYDADRQALGWIDPSMGIPEWHSDDNSLRVLGELLQVAAKSFPGGFPDGELCASRVRQVLERIKLLAKQDRTSGGLLDRFLETQIVLAPGSDITSLEIRAKYVTYCHALGRAPCSQSRFFRVLKAKLHSMGVDQRHDIERNGKPVRGYGGLAFKSEVPPQTSDVTDATDGSDAASNTPPK